MEIASLLIGLGVGISLTLIFKNNRQRDICLHDLYNVLHDINRTLSFMGDRIYAEFAINNDYYLTDSRLVGRIIDYANRNNLACETTEYAKGKYFYTLKRKQ